MTTPVPIQISLLAEVNEFVLINLEAQYYAVRVFLQQKSWSADQILAWMLRYGSVFQNKKDTEHAYFGFHSIWGFSTTFYFKNTSTVALVGRTTTGIKRDQTLRKLGLAPFQYDDL